MTEQLRLHHLRLILRAPRLLLISATLVICGSTSAATQDVSTPNVSTQESSELIAQRRLFIRAREQLDAGDDKGFQQSLAELVGYPLHDYLRFEQLQKSFRSKTPERDDVSALNAFERSTGHVSMTRRLTQLLQQRLAKTEQWELFLGVSQSRYAAAMPCTTVRAAFETGQIKGFDERVIAQWVKPIKQDEVCADVLSQIEEQETPPVAAIWTRIFQAMEANRPELAEPMLGYLASSDRKLVRRWVEVDDNPEEWLLSGELAQNTVLNRHIIADLIVEWSRKDTLAAVEHWLKIRGNYTFFGDRYYETHRALVMRAAYRRLPEAQRWLGETKERKGDLELAEWRVRTALYVQDWDSVLTFIKRLPAEEAVEDHWAYWVARANEELGNTAEALRIYAQLARLQSYHGFLAADKLGEDYAIYDEPIVLPKELLASLRVEPSLLRAREFERVSLENESRREWNNWLSQTRREPAQLAAAAVVASEWGLHDRSIYTAGRSGEDYRRAISLRFPVLYRSEVAKASVENSIEPSWIFGVIRRESAYIRDVQSSAGAVGLMQLMPRTAKYVADLQGLKDWRGDLTDAGTNIGLGTHYLRYVMNKFDDNQVLATAGYNAGPHRVDAWLREEETDADLWIDTILFTETRRYVRAVMAYAAIYEYHLTGKPVRLSDKLKVVPAAPDV